MRHGFVYLIGLIDVASRRVLAHKRCTTLEAHHAVEIVEQASNRLGAPEIVNTDQGSQFTASEFTEAIQKRGIKLSMDGKGAWRDNVFVERFWRTVKYERIYKRAYDTVSEARADIAEYIAWYNEQRPHTSLGDRTPKRAYDESLAKQAAAAMKVAA
jgi:putative transposase